MSKDLRDTPLPLFLASELKASVTENTDCLETNPYEESFFLVFSDGDLPAMSQFRPLLESYFEATFGKISNLLVTDASVHADVRYPFLGEEPFEIKVEALLKRSDTIAVSLTSSYGTVAG